MKKKNIVVAVISLVVVSLLVASCQLVPSGDTTSKDVATISDSPSINVTGIGEVYVEPDVAYVTLGVRSQSEQAGDAVSDNNVLADAIIEALKANGVEEKDINTSSFNVYWTEEWQGEGQPYKKTYVVENMVDVTVRQIDTLGEVLDAALAAGANSVYNVQFDVQDKSEASEQARVLAVDDAKAQAEQLAAAAGVSVGDLILISSYSAPVTVQPMYAVGMGGGGGMGTADSSVPMAGGEMVVQIQVNLVYAIEQ